MTTVFDAAVVGRCVQDHSFFVNADLIHNLKTDDVRVEATNHVTMGGGPGATAAVTMARLGLKVAFIGRAGGDPTGRQIKEEIESYGVNVDGLELDENIKSRTTIVFVNETLKSRSFLSHGSTFPEKLRQTQIQILEHSNALHLDWYNSASLQAVNLFANTGRQITYDIFKYDQRILRQTRLCTIASMSKAAAENCMAELLGKAYVFDDLSETTMDAIGSELRNIVCSTTIVTLGEMGCVVCAENGVKHYPTLAKTQIIDTTGAGDVFNGALAAALIWGKTLDESARFAVAAASLSCQGVGGRGKIPSLEEVEMHRKMNAYEK